MATEPDITNLGDDEIELRPTKQLFVDILTRDILLNRAILDLVDNSIDGARRLRPGADQSLADLEVLVDIKADQFRIKDNCGGIGIDIAKHYAFRFGRPKDMPSTPNSVGQFGVGMKRALFKFGRFFEIVSQSTVDRFTVRLDVDDWEKDETHWRIKFADSEAGLNVPVKETGTTITVSRLRESVSSSFALENFVTSVAREIQAAQQTYIDRGLRIAVNGRTLLASPWQLQEGAGFASAKTEIVLSQFDKPVVIRVFAGVGTSTPQAAGWYIFCNGRMILEGDQTSSTGWASLATTANVTIPKYHNQFSRFRGFVFFDSENASLLPWDTTKTGVDFDSAVYQAALLYMIELMRPIIDFLNELDAENEFDQEADKVLTAAISRTMPVAIKSIQRSGAFVQPPKSAQSSPSLGTISYKRPREKIRELREAFGAAYDKTVGEKSFDLAYANYIEKE
jgi:hypothetical protein